jgi:hypothetical protein
MLEKRNKHEWNCNLLFIGKQRRYQQASAYLNFQHRIVQPAVSAAAVMLRNTLREATEASITRSKSSLQYSYKTNI